MLIELLTVFLVSTSVYANKTFSKIDDIQLKSDRLLIVVHASSHWNLNKSAESGVNEAIDAAKAYGTERLYIVHDFQDGYYISDWNADVIFNGNNGQLYGSNTFGLWVPIEFAAKNILLAGGYVTDCVQQAANDSISLMNMRHPNEDIQLTFQGRGSFSYDYWINPVYDRVKPILLELWKNGQSFCSECTLEELFNLITDSQLQKDMIFHYVQDYLILPRERTVEISLDGSYLYTQQVGTGAEKLQINFLTK